MNRSHHSIPWVLAVLFTFVVLQAQGQVVKSYTIRDGKMVITLDKRISPASLDSFITRYDLSELALPYYLRTQSADSLYRAGWEVMSDKGNIITLSKSMQAVATSNDPVDKIIFTEKHPTFAELFPAVNNGIVAGINKFRNKPAFAIEGSTVTFYLKENHSARRVQLAGSFTNWESGAITMTHNDSGWIATVTLSPGKYWYKFISDGNWILDRDNQLRENDGLGNINSVYFRTNTVFHLNGYTNARNVYLAGSFNNWRPKDLAMTRTPSGWELPLYLAKGTHTYKFVVDGNWLNDETNPEKLPDSQGGMNSVLRLGKPYPFALNGYTNARQVVLSGTFNGWKEDELYMKKTATGWELPYVLGPGNYEYKFIVDGQWMTDPANPLTVNVKNNTGNSYLIIEPNYTFRLKGRDKAQNVYLAGDFNGWKPDAFPMKRSGNDWIFSVHLATGKHRYKFVVDGQWIIDPDNKLWEQNEFGTGNSILWIDK